MTHFENSQEITKHFIEDGWDPNTSFSELTLQEAKEKKYSFAIAQMSKGRKYFRMNVTGNIYNDNGKIALYNLKSSCR